MTNINLDAAFICFLAEHERDPERAFVLLQQLVADPFSNELRCNLPDSDGQEALGDGFGYTEAEWLSLVSCVATLGVKEAHRRELVTLNQLEALTCNVAALRAVNERIIGVPAGDELQSAATSMEPDITSQPELGANPTPRMPWWLLALAAVFLIGASLTFIDFDFSRPVVAEVVALQMEMREKRSIEEPWKLTALRPSDAPDGFATVMKVTDEYPTSWERLNKSVGSGAVDVLDPALSGRYRYAVLITPKKINEAKFRKLIAAAAEEVRESKSAETDRAWMQAVVDGLGKMGHAKIEFSIISAQPED